jgi:hypothetical protein
MCVAMPGAPCRRAADVTPPPVPASLSNKAHPPPQAQYVREAALDGFVNGAASATLLGGSGPPAPPAGLAHGRISSHLGPSSAALGSLPASLAAACQELVIAIRCGAAVSGWRLPACA